MQNDISILSEYKGKIEETGGKRLLRLIPEGKMKVYEKRMLTESGCPYTLPAFFISEEGIDTAYYDVTGNIPLEAYLRRKPPRDKLDGDNGKQVIDALNLLSGILDCMKGLERYLIFSERYTIHPDLFFVNPENESISIAFWPNNKPEIPLHKRLLHLIDFMIEVCGDDTVRYLNKLRDLMDEKNPGLDGLIRMVGTLSREAGYIFWNGRVLREADRNPTREEDLDLNKEGVDEKRMPPLLKPAVIQVFFAAVLVTVYLSGKFDPVSFAGLAIILAGADLWLMRRIK